MTARKTFPCVCISSIIFFHFILSFIPPKTWEHKSFLLFFLLLAHFLYFVYHYNNFSTFCFKWYGEQWFTLWKFVYSLKVVNCYTRCPYNGLFSFEFDSVHKRSQLQVRVFSSQYLVIWIVTGDRRLHDQFCCLAE